MKLINFLRSKLLFLDKDQQDVMLSSFLMLLVVICLKFFIQDTMMMWPLVLPLQFLITKFILASKVTQKDGFVVDTDSGIKAAQSFKYLIIPFVFTFLTAFSIVAGFIISDEYQGVVSEISQVICLLLPFIITRSYTLIKKLPLSFLYIFCYHEVEGNIIVPQDFSIYNNPFPQTTMPVEETLHTKTRRMLDDWDYFYSPRSYVRRHLNDD